MDNRIIVITGNYHLGDNAGVFQDALFIGHSLSLPIQLTWVNSKSNNVSFMFTTHDIETWGGKGHKVSINGHEIGRLKDPANTYGRNEEFVINLPTKKFETLLGGQNNFTLSINLENQSSSPSGDDFVLTRIDSKDVALKIGWN